MSNNNDGMPDPALPPPYDPTRWIRGELIGGIKNLASELACRSEYDQKVENPDMSLQSLESLFLKLQSRVFRDSLKTSEQGPMELTEVSVINLDFNYAVLVEDPPLPTDFNLCLRYFRKFVHQEANGEELIQRHKRQISEKNLLLWYSGGDIRTSKLSNVSNWVGQRVLGALHTRIAALQPGNLASVDATVHVTHKKVYMMPYRVEKRPKLLMSCIICLESLWNVETQRAYKCTHIFHSRCIEDYRNRNLFGRDQCPVCKRGPKRGVPHG